MDEQQSTTLTRRSRNSFPKRTFLDNERKMCPVSLFAKTGEGYEQVPDVMLVECARLVLQAHFRPGAAVLRNRQLLQDFLTFEIGARDYETFGLVLLDSGDRLIDYVELFQGTPKMVYVHARTVVECVLKHRATAVILVHNHPHGNAQPSDADRALTDRLRRALAVVDVQVVDHLIVGEAIFSFADRGLLLR